MLPILHLNGFKIHNPTILSRIPHSELESFFRGCGWEPPLRGGQRPGADAPDHGRRPGLGHSGRSSASRPTPAPPGTTAAPAWPMIVLRTPKGWTGPKEVDGQTIEGSFRAHQVPIDMSQPHHLKLVEDWLRSYHPEEALHRGGQAPPRTPGPGPQGGTGGWGPTPRQRRQAAAGPETPPTSATTASTCPPPAP